jgi:hypothetical protein
MRKGSLPRGASAERIRRCQTLKGRVTACEFANGASLGFLLPRNCDPEQQTTALTLSPRLGAQAIGTKTYGMRSPSASAPRAGPRSTTREFESAKKFTSLERLSQNCDCFSNRR